MEKAITFIDGFNLYYGMKAQGWERYLWLDVKAFSLSIVKPNHRLVEVRYYTSIVLQPDDKRQRHQRYVDALGTLPDVKISLGHFYINRNRSKEKMTDVSIAVDLICGALKDEFDVAYLVTGDSDLVPAVKAVKNLFAGKKIIAVFPPNRLSHHLKQECHGVKGVRKRDLSSSQLPDSVVTEDQVALERPEMWA